MCGRAVARVCDQFSLDSSSLSPRRLGADAQQSAALRFASWIVADPRHGTLANNGGPTQTLAPAPGSPAIDVADTCAGTIPATDQRGYQRWAGAAPDLGAYEVGAVEVSPDVVFANGFESGGTGCP